MSTVAEIVPSTVTGSTGPSDSQPSQSGSTIQRQSSIKLVEDWTKSVISQLKKSNASEKNELQRLNAELKVYLDNTRALENLNKRLLDEVEKARNRALPSIMDKTEHDKELDIVRQRLEQESLEVVRNQIQIEENQSLNQHLSDRIRFFSKEADLQRLKIQALQNQLAEISNQRESLLRSARLAEDDRKREEERAEQAEQTLANLRKQLGDSRLRHKKVEFELQSVVDEIEFRKALFQEEANDLRTRYNSLGNVIPGVDINDFYKKELHNAIRQIKEDFHTLNQQQLDDYKRNKEFELSAKTREFENERKQAELARSKLLAANDVESQNSVELKNSFTKEKTELEQERARHTQLVNKLGQLEERLKNSREGNFFILEKLQKEIDSLREHNGTYSNELAFWEKVTRLKLEAEIQTYRSILNSQLKLMQTALPQGGSFSSATVVDINANRKPTNGSSTNKQTTSSTGSRMEAKSKDDAINILRQIFDYFDRDKSGKINSFELDEILQRMNIQLTLESYNQLLKEFDKDCKFDIL